MADTTGRDGNKPGELAERDRGSVAILGQVISLPTHWASCVAWCMTVICATVAVYFVVVLGRLEFDGSKATFGNSEQRNVVFRDGVPVDQRTYQFAFWTPSAKTAESIGSDVGPDGKPLSPEAWQVLESGNEEDKLKQFGRKLRGDGKLVNGYRRFEVRGHGRTDYKAGYWWIVSVSQEYKMEDFVQLYLAEWQPTKDGKPHNSVYVEVSDWRFAYR